MKPPDEHSDDLEPQVEEGAAIETERYDEEDEAREIPPGADAAADAFKGPRPDRVDAELEQNPDDESSDTI